MSVRDSKRRCFLITGGAGFIGSHLAERLLDAGNRVLLLDDLSTGSRENIEHLLDHPRLHFAHCSITQQTVLDRLTSEADVVIHLAAAVGVKLIVERPAHTIETNVFGTEAVLRAALRYGCRVLLASTSEVYGKGARIPFHEDDDVVLGATLRSRWSYAASKMVDEFLGLAYHRQHGLDVLIARLFNTVGPRQTGRYGMVIPRFVGQALRGDPLTVFGDGTQSRCFCDVRDITKALASLVDEPDAQGRVFNVGATEEISILDLAHQIKELSGSNSPITHVPYEEAYAPGFEDMYRRVPDISRIRATIGWGPQWRLHDILESVLAFERGRVERRRPVALGAGA